MQIKPIMQIKVQTKYDIEKAAGGEIKVESKEGEGNHTSVRIHTKQGNNK